MQQLVNISFSDLSLTVLATSLLGLRESLRHGPPCLSVPQQHSTCQLSAAYFDSENLCSFLLPDSLLEIIDLRVYLLLYSMPATP